MKFFYAVLLSVTLGINVHGANILELVRTLDANDTAKFKSMVQTSEDANALRSDNNKTVLMYASWIGNADAVEHLVSKGADVNEQDESGATALHLAIWKAHNKIALLLIHHGASANSMSKEGMTPLDIAVLKGNQEIAEAIKNAAPKLKPLL